MGHEICMGWIAVDNIVLVDNVVVLDDDDDENKPSH